MTTSQSGEIQRDFLGRLGGRSPRFRPLREGPGVPRTFGETRGRQPSRSAWIASALFVAAGCSESATFVPPADAGVVADGGAPEGGRDAGVAAEGASCGVDADCRSRNCVGGACRPASCTNGKRDGEEAAIDCGAGCPLKCDNEGCSADTECKSHLCVTGVCLARELRACGAGTGTLCGSGALCERNEDCVSGSCVESFCK
jgi:hypothetical protein